MFRPVSRARATTSALLALSLAWGGASADIVLQQSRFNEYINSSFGSPAGDEVSPETITLVSTVDGWGSVNALVSTRGGGRPRAQVDVLMNIEPQSFSAKYVQGVAEVRYYWAVEQVGGPAWNDSVPVDIATQGLSSYTIDSVNGPGMQNMYAKAFFDTAGDGNRTYNATPCIVDCKIPGTFAFDEAFTADVTPNVANRVQLTTVVWASLFDGIVDATAWVDPVITINADFARRDDFRIVFGNGVTPVPLPASALLLAVCAPVMAWRKRVRAGA